MAAISAGTWPSLSQVQRDTSGQEPPWWLVELIIGMIPLVYYTFGYLTQGRFSLSTLAAVSYFVFSPTFGGQ